MTTTDHYLIRHSYPGSYGDRPTPAELTFTCGCGVELWEQFEGSSSPALTPDEALQEHVLDVEIDAIARQLNTDGWTCQNGAHEPGEFDRCDDCREACTELAHFLHEHEYVTA